LTLNDDNTKSALRQLRETIETIRRAETLAHDIFKTWGLWVLRLFYTKGSIDEIPIILLLVAATVTTNPVNVLVAFGIHLLRVWLGYTEPAYMGLWRRRAKLIEDQFPQLVGLVDWEQEGRE
jgi:hypothetical protein